MRKIAIPFIICMLCAPLFAKELFLESTGEGVKTDRPKPTKRVYLGSYLAKGHLPASEIYRIDAPVEGIIQTLSAHIYDPVKKGEKLLVIKSPELLELEAKYIDSLIQFEYYEAEVARLRPLYEAAVVAKKRYLEAENRLRKFETQSSFYRYLLMEWGLSKSEVQRMRESKKPLATLAVSAPVTGFIDDMAVHPKMYVARGEHMLTIINPKGVHMEIALPVAVAEKLKRGDRLYADGEPAKVESISATVDPRTQTVAIHLLPVKSASLKAGEKRNVKLYWPKEAYKLPSSAVIEYGGTEAVFVKSAKGFRLLPVTVLGRSGGRVYLTGKGLTQESEVAVSGVIALKGALEGAEGD
ncbi:efflux RND transporter periplasmic adaptor subunit [Hydrogenimonas sp.]